MARALSLLVLSIGLAAGCFGRDSGVALRPVSGIVRHGGQPLINAEVVFLPLGQEAGVRAARGVTDSQGRYVLKTYFTPAKDADGALPGRYRVVVREMHADAIASRQIVDPFQTPSQSNRQAAAKDSNTSGKVATADSSDWKATVTADGTNQIDIDLDLQAAAP